MRRIVGQDVRSGAGSWLVPTAVVAVLLVLAFLSGAGEGLGREGAVGAAPPASNDLVGVRVSADEVTRLFAWGITPAYQKENGTFVLHVTDKQLAQLRDAGLVFERLGLVAISNSAGPELTADCRGAVYPNIAVTGGWQRSHINLSSCSVPAGVRVTSVAYDIRFQTNYYNQHNQPGCAPCQSQLDLTSRTQPAACGCTHTNPNVVMTSIHHVARRRHPHSIAVS